MADIRKQVLVVGYDCVVGLVTTDREEAEKFLVKKRGQNQYLPWAIRNVEDAIFHAFGSGLKDGEMNR
jgi:hypothetical protein